MRQKFYYKKMVSTIYYGSKIHKIFTAKFNRKEDIIMSFFKIISAIANFINIVDAIIDVIQFISNAIKKRKN